LAAIASLQPYKKSNEIQIKTYGMISSPLDEQAQQEIWEWIASTMMVSNYIGLAHLIFSDARDYFINWEALRGYFREQPVLLYRCGDRTPLIPYGCYWRLMGEHSSLRIYQMEKLSE